MEDVSIIGRKTFFISSDADLITEPILERLMSHGYEAYVIADDARCLMKKKVEDIIRMFPGCILYFNVGSKVIGIEWKAYIKDLCARHRIDAKIGIMYKGTSSAEESVQLEGYYLNEARVGIGCLSLAGDDVEIYDRLLEALARAGARGRRKIVRVNADYSSSVLFPHEKAILNDISRSYFRCCFEEALEARIYDRFNGLRINFCGMEFACDAVLVMKHTRAGVNYGIFMFVKEDGSPELEDEQKAVLNKRIYKILTAACKESLEAAFAIA